MIAVGIGCQAHANHAIKGVVYEGAEMDGWLACLRGDRINLGPDHCRSLALHDGTDTLRGILCNALWGR